MWYEFNEDNTDIIVKRGGGAVVPIILRIGLNLETGETYEKYLTYVKTDKNGTKHYKSQVCSKCVGKGKLEYHAHHGGHVDIYDCGTCKGTGQLKRAKVYKVHTPEYGKVLEQEYRKKQHEKMYEEECINREDNTTCCYIGDTYSIKSELKKKGAKYDRYLGWHTAQPLEGYPYIKVVVPIVENEDGTMSVERGIYPELGSSMRIINPKMIDIQEQIKEASKEYLNSK